MFGSDRRLAPRALFDGYENRDGAPETMDEFMSVLMIAYEQALEEGVSPPAALAAVLDWVSLELRRCAGLHHIVE